MCDEQEAGVLTAPLATVADTRTPIVYGIVQPGPESPGGVPFVQSRDVGGAVEVHALQRTSPEIAEQYRRSKIAPGDILFSLRGNIGQSSITPAELDGANIARGVARIRVGANGDPEFVRYVLQGPALQRLIARNANGSTFRELSIEELRKLPIPDVGLPKQRKIAEILRTWDEALEKLTALRAAKLKRHRGLTMGLVFGRWRLHSFRTTDEVAPYRWFKLPASWSCQPIGDLAKEISERNGERGQHEVLSCSKHDGFVRSLEYFKKRIYSTDLSGYKKIWRGDFGFPSNHVEEGSIGLQNLTDIGVVSPIYTVFRFNSDEVNARYAIAVLKTGLYRHIFEVSTSASVDRRGSLRWREFSRLPFPLPPLAEQEAIAEVIWTSRRELDALTDEIDAVSRQKRGLMQKLLTGEWRVKREEELA